MISFYQPDTFVLSRFHRSLSQVVPWVEWRTPRAPHPQPSSPSLPSLRTVSRTEFSLHGRYCSSSSLGFQPIRTCYLGHVTGYHPINDLYPLSTREVLLFTHCSQVLLKQLVRVPKISQDKAESIVQVQFILILIIIIIIITMFIFRSYPTGTEQRNCCCHWRMIWTVNILVRPRQLIPHRTKNKTKKTPAHITIGSHNYRWQNT